MHCLFLSILPVAASPDKSMVGDARVRVFMIDPLPGINASEIVALRPGTTCESAIPADIAAQAAEGKISN